MKHESTFDFSQEGQSIQSFHFKKNGKKPKKIKETYLADHRVIASDTNVL